MSAPPPSNCLSAHSRARPAISSFARLAACTSSGPSARRRVRAPTHRYGRIVSPHTPAAPCAWIAKSTHADAAAGQDSFAMAMAPEARLAPTASSDDAAA